MALGYRQIAGLDFNEIHAPVLNEVGMRMMLLIAIKKGWLVRKLDVEAAFLLGKLKEEIFIVLPEGLEEEKGKIGRLNSAIYGLAQAARVFFETVKKFLVDFMNFDVCISDSCIFIKHNIILGLYVDDILIIGENDAVYIGFNSFGPEYILSEESYMKILN